MSEARIPGTRTRRQRVLEATLRSPGITTEELSGLLALHNPSALNELLSRLVHAGLVGKRKGEDKRNRWYPPEPKPPET